MLSTRQVFVFIAYALCLRRIRWAGRASSGARCGAQRHTCPSAHTLCTTLFARSDGRWG